jgi:transposase
LGSIGPPGRGRYLDGEQEGQLRQVLRAGAKQYGFAADGWTLVRVRRVIGERFSVWFSTLGGVAVLLHRMGFSAQRPQRRAAERDEVAVATWVEDTWPEIEKRGPKAGRGSVLPMRPAVH